MGIKKSAVLLLIFFIFISACQPKEKIEISEEVEESAGSGFLVIGTLPSDADVFMDNIYSGKSPLTLSNIAAGSHNIVIKKEGYENFVSDVKIEAGRKTFLEATLILIPIVEKKPEIPETVEEKEKEEIVEGIEEEKKEIGTLKANGIVNIGKKFVLYYDFSEGKFIENRQLNSDVFSKRFDKHIVFTRFDPVNIKVIDKNIDEVKKEDCINVKDQFEYLYSGKTLCVITMEGEIAALGGTWENTENAKLSWKLFS